MSEGLREPFGDTLVDALMVTLGEFSGEEVGLSESLGLRELEGELEEERVKNAGVPLFPGETVAHAVGCAEVEPGADHEALPVPRGVVETHGVFVVLPVAERKMVTVLALEGVTLALLE